MAKGSHKKRREAAPAPALPPIERGQHGEDIEMIETPVAGVMAARVKWEKRDALLVYTHLRLITESQFSAGMLFRLDWYALHKEQRVVAAYAAYIDQGGSSEAWNGIRTAATKRYDKASLKLAAKGLMDISITCICRGENVGPGRIVRLREALNILAQNT